MASENYFDPQTGTYHYQGQTFNNSVDYSAAVQNFRQSQGLEFQESSAAGQATANLNNLSATTQANSSNNDIPSWVDPDYGYDPSNPRKPNMREMMETLSGRTVEELYADPDSNWQDISKQASQMLYGVVGSNNDTRNWNAIFDYAKTEVVDEAVESAQSEELNNVEKILIEKHGWKDNGDGTLRSPQGYRYDHDVEGEANDKFFNFDKMPTKKAYTYDPGKLKAAIGAATSQMYGGTTVEYVSGGLQVDETGNVMMDDMGQPLKTAPRLMIVGGNGSILTSLPANADSGLALMESFGIRDTSWIDRVSALMPQDELAQFQPAFDTWSVNYRPWEQYEGLWEGNYVTGVMETVDPYDLSKYAVAKTEDTQLDQQAGEIQAGETVTQTDTSGADTAATDQPTYGGGSGAPQAVGNVSTYTPSPVTTQITGGFQPTYTPYEPVAATTTTKPFQTDTGMYPTDTGTTTTTTPLQTAGLSAVPQTVTTYPNYTGTTMANLTSASQGGSGFRQVPYQNQYGQTMMITVDGNGNPVSYVPYGFTKAPGYAEGGVVDATLDAEYQMASTFLGYDGPKSRRSLDAFISANPNAAARMGKYKKAMSGFASGGYVKGFNEGGTTLEQFQGMQQNLITQGMQPIAPPVNMIEPEEADFIGTSAGQTVAQAPYAEASTVGTVKQAASPLVPPTTVMTPATVGTGVQQVTEGLTAAQGELGQQSQVTAAQQEGTSVSGMEAAQGEAIMMDNPVQREIQEGELISGVADAEKASKYTEQIQAATATPTKQATVQGQLEGLMQQFEGGETPPWAAGSMRAAMATLAARGLGASSLAGQAVIQATMEAALPIAQMDAQTQAQFESQNLSNRQQRAMLAAQQRAAFLQQEFDQEFQSRVQNSARIGDIANMNFTAEQNIALENSRAANTMNLNNLSNRQAMVMAEAAALSQLDMANLNNRQQAAVQNAQNFLQMDMANLSNAQATAIFKAQQNIQALFTDQAAENAAAQFNASSENQTNQFFANLQTQTAQFNVSQQNAMDQFNVSQVNAIRQFNSEQQQQRDMFNAQNGLVVAQANAQWRQNIATLNTAALNESNMMFAKTINNLSQTNLDAIWQRERDIISMAFKQSESLLDRANSITLQKMAADATIEAAQFQADVAAAQQEGQFEFELFSWATGIGG